MSTIEEVKAAEAAWVAAHKALFDYVNRPLETQTDIALHLRLAEGLQLALNRYVRLVRQLRH